MLYMPGIHSFFDERVAGVASFKEHDVIHTKNHKNQSLEDVML